MNILIVDDDRDDAQLLCEAIHECSPDVDCRIVYSVGDARETFKHFLPDVVFIDAIMHPIGAKDVMEEFSGMAALQNTKFIVISGFLLPDHYSTYTRLGANFVITKPSNYTSLVEYVKKILTEDAMYIRVKLFTNDNIVHNQTAALQQLLERDINFEISLNTLQPRPQIQFYVSDTELRKIKSESEYNVLFFDGHHWLPII